jgi:hypothetical protein
MNYEQIKQKAFNDELEKIANDNSSMRTKLKTVNTMKDDLRHNKFMDSIVKMSEIELGKSDSKYRK